MIRQKTGRGYLRSYFTAALLLTTFICGFGLTAQAGRLTISSLPYNITQAQHSGDLWDTVLISGTRLTSASNGIRFEGTNYWLVQGLGDTLIYGNSSTNSAHGAYGISIGGGNGSDFIVIKDLFILNRPVGIDTLTYSAEDTLSGRTNGIITGYSCDNITVENCRIEVQAYSSHGINIGRGHTQLFRNIAIRHSSPGFHSRCQFDACGVKLSGLRSTDLTGGATYNARMQNIKIERCSHAGIYGSAYSGYNAVIQAEACTVTVSSKNIMYTSGGNTCEGRANCYGIQYTGAGPGSYIKHCKITADEGNHGGRGIQMVGCEGTPENPIVICSSYVNVHESADVQFTGTYGYYPCAVKVRQDNYGVHVFDNQFIYVADGSVPWGTTSGSYYRSGESGLYEHWTSNLPPFNNGFERNLFRAVDRSSGAVISGFTFDNCTQGYDPSFFFRYNRVESDYVGYKWGGYDGEAHSFTIIGDTLKIVDTANSSTWAYQLGYLNMNYRTDDIIMQDIVYEGVADEGRIYFPATQGSADIAFRRTLKVYIKGSNGLPVSGASVTVRNNYSQIVLTGTTGSDGKVSGPVTYNFQSRAGTDSTGFNNFRINATKGADNAQVYFLVGWDSFKDTLTLPATAGDGSWVPDEDIDTIPPAAVQDLGSLPLPSNFEVVHLAFGEIPDLLGNGHDAKMDYLPSAIASNPCRREFFGGGMTA